MYNVKFTPSALLTHLSCSRPSFTPIFRFARPHPRSIKLRRLFIFVFVFVVFVAALTAGCSRDGAQAAAAAQLPPIDIELIGQWGVHGQSPGQLDQPVGLAVDLAGRVYVADRGTGFVQKFTLSGSPLLTFEDDAIRDAAGMAVDSGGAIYAAAPRAGRIHVFFPEGRPLSVFRMPPQRGFEGPFIFSVDAEGAVFVPDPAGGRIRVLSPRGRLEKMWNVSAGLPGEPVRPVAAVAGPDGFVYVSDALTGRVLKFTPGGERIAVWGNPLGTARLSGLAVSQDHVFLLHGAGPQLEIWTLDGRQEFSDDLGGRVGRAFSAVSLALAPGGELLVLDAAEPRVLRFRLPLGTP